MTDGLAAARHTPVAPVSPRSNRLAIALAFASETACALSAVVMRLSPIEIVGAHLVIVTLLAVALRRPIRSGADGGAALLAVIGTLVTGPFGALGALVLPALNRQGAVEPALLKAWYDRIALSAEQDGLTTLSDRVSIGRAANLSAPLPQAFVALFTSGPIAEQQTALGMIARGFHTGYLPVLKMALNSPEPVIRVQAAAVAARVRDQLNAQIPILADRAADPTLSSAAAIELADQLRMASDSGLLEAAEQRIATSTRAGLLGRTFARLDVRGSKALAGETVTPDAFSDERDDAYAAHLLSAGRFSEFRRWRSAIRRPVRGRYRQRLVISRRAGSELRAALAPFGARRLTPGHR